MGCPTGLCPHSFPRYLDFPGFPSHTLYGGPLKIAELAALPYSYWVGLAFGVVLCLVLCSIALRGRHHRTLDLMIGFASGLAVSIVAYALFSIGR